MKCVKKRGVIVYLSPQGEANRRVGLYTEEGMLYFTIYGARSSKNHHRSSLNLFNMGRFEFTIGANNIHKFVDAQIFERCLALSSDIKVYYAACVGAEIVKIMVGAEHEMQFNVLVHFLLYLINIHTAWQGALIIFLWRSLIYNGWQPNIPSIQSANNRCYIRYLVSDGFVWVSKQDAEFYYNVIEYTSIERLVQSNKKNYSESCALLDLLDTLILQKLIEVLFDIWQHTIGYKLKASEFVVH